MIAWIVHGNIAVLGHDDSIESGIVGVHLKRVSYLTIGRFRNLLWNLPDRRHGPSPWEVCRS